jgi:hypothetical protein
VSSTSKRYAVEDRRRIPEIQAPLNQRSLSLDRTQGNAHCSFCSYKNMADWILGK